MDGFMHRLRDERGITSVVVAVCIVALIGAAMLTIDAGSVFTTRRSIITGTDASALDAAQLFNSGGASPCTGAGIDFANQHATDVLHQNQSGGIHDVTDPSLFEVTLYDPAACNTGGYTPGKVRYDGRLTATGFFSKFFGFGDTKPFSSSTAAWGYITAIGSGLRPIAVCDASDNYQQYVQYWNGLHGRTPSITEDQYDALWGTDQGTGTPEDPGHFPSVSMGFPSGDAAPNGPNDDKANPNYGLPYVNPLDDARFHTVHRILNPDPACGEANGNRDWVDLRGADVNGVPGASNLEEWLLNGYPGTVSLEPHDCNTSDTSTGDEDCGSAPGDQNKLMKALHTITCSAATPALSCNYIFPILVVSCVGERDESGACVQTSGTGGENAHYEQVAFLFVVLRGFGNINSSGNPDDNDDPRFVVGLDLEFVDVQTTGEVAGAPPSENLPYQTGTQLCGADRADNHCPF